MYFALLERSFFQMCQVLFFQFHECVPLVKCIFCGYSKNDLRKHLERVHPRSTNIVYIVNKKELKVELL